MRQMRAERDAPAGPIRATTGESSPCASGSCRSLIDTMRSSASRDSAPRSAAPRRSSMPTRSTRSAGVGTSSRPDWELGLKSLIWLESIFLHRLLAETGTVARIRARSVGRKRRLTAQIAKRCTIPELCHRSRDGAGRCHPRHPYRWNSMLLARGKRHRSRLHRRCVRVPDSHVLEHDPELSQRPVVAGEQSSHRLAVVV